MKIVFIIQRTTTYRYFAPLIAAGIKRNHKVECWLNYMHPKNDLKGYLFPHIEFSPFYNQKHENLTYRKIRNKYEYEKLFIEEKDVDYYVSFHPFTDYYFPAKEEIIKRIQKKWCIIMHSLTESFAELILYKDFLNYKYNPFFFVSSEHIHQEGIDFIKKFYPNSISFFSKERMDVVPVGSTMLDPSNRRLNTDKIKKKYGINRDKNILIYLPYPYQAEKIGGRYHGDKEYGWAAAFSGFHINEFLISRRNNKKIFLGLVKYFFRKFKCTKQILFNHEARNYFIKGLNEPAIIKSLRKFCDNNGLVFVVKPRKKYPCVEEIYKLADIVVEDDESQQFPSKLQELFFISELTIGCLTSAVIESIYHNVPFVNIEIPNSAFYDHESRYLYDYKKGSIYNYQNVAYNFSINEMIKKFYKMKKNDFKFDKKLRQNYLEKYVGAEEYPASENFYKFIESVKVA